MDSISENIVLKSSPGQEKNWADRLLIAGLMIYAFSSTFSIAASQTGLGLALIAFIALYRDGKVKFKPTSFAGPYAFLVLAGILAIFRAELPLRALNEAKSFLVIFAFFLIYWPHLKQHQHSCILNVYLLSASLMAAYSCVFPYVSEQTLGHAQGFFSTSLTFGECQAMAALALTHKLAAENHTNKTRILWMLALITIIVSLILSFTRGAWVGFAAGLSVIFAGFPRKLLPVVIISALVVAIAINVSPYLRERVAGFDLSRILKTTDKSFDQNFESVTLMSSFHRLYIWQRGFVLLGENNSFGIGAKNMKHHYNLLATDYERENQLIWSHQHNNFMHMLLSYGFIGLIAFFYFILSLGKFAWNGTGSINYGAMAIFICFLTFGLTEHSWGDEEVIMMAFFLTGLMLATTEKKAAQA